MPIMIKKYRVLCADGHLTVYEKKADLDRVDNKTWRCKKRATRYGPPCECERVWFEEVFVEKYRRGPTPGTELTPIDGQRYVIPGEEAKYPYKVGDTVTVVQGEERVKARVETVSRGRVVLTYEEEDEGRE